jgi:hypothetical protein
MNRSKRGTAFAVLVSVAMMAVAIGCGGDDKKDDGDGGHHGSAGNVRNGTWHITTRTVSAPLTSFCDFSDTTEIDEEVCNLQSEFEQGVEGSGTSILCDFQIVGDTYTVSCSGDTVIGFCTVTITADGGGTFTDTTYTFNATFVVTVVGPAQYCGAVAPCTLTVNEEGQWLNGEFTCEDDTTTAGISPIGRAWRTVLGPGGM